MFPSLLCLCLNLCLNECKARMQRVVFTAQRFDTPVQCRYQGFCDNDTQIPPMMTPDWSVEILGSECNSIKYCIHFNIFLND